jgi:Tol biopolymer transport system component
VTSDRRELVKELLIRISEIPEHERAAFLAEACSDDPGLREDIEELLRYAGVVPDWLLSAERTPEEEKEFSDPSMMIGRVVSHYRIVGKIGGGGMGVVYKAEHSRLPKTVALKFLPPDLIRDEKANQRFMNEAHAASALDHPNICTIFDIDRTDEGQLFIAMAYYKGENLQQRIERGPVGIRDALDIVVQTLDGLRASHQAGIIHRDIKPANLILATSGLVKIVDFGLAKLAGQSRLTKKGARLGTISYMSPEQVRGEELDSRSDIWAVGVTFYEMLTGELPFKGDDAATIYSIENRDPKSMSSLRPDVPRDLESIVARAMEKRADERYQSTEDFLSDLQSLQQQRLPDEGRPVRWVVQRRELLKKLLLKPKRLLVTLAAAILVLATVYVLTKIFRPPKPVPRLTNARQITSARGVEDFPTWSPDGRLLAYSSQQSGNLDIWVTQVGSGQPVNRTRAHEGRDTRPSWSPDGSQIAFASERDEGGIFVMPAIGGAPRKVGDVPARAACSPQWSPDGSEIAYFPSDTSQSIEIVNVITNESRRLQLPPHKERRGYGLAWSPDGRFFAYGNVVWGLTGSTRIWVFRVADGRSFPVTDSLSYDVNPSWSADGRALYFISKRRETDRDLYMQRLHKDGRPEGEAIRLRSGMGVRRASFSPDDRMLAYSSERGTDRPANLWRIPILEDRSATWHDAQQITFDETRTIFVDVSPDGTQLIVSSNRAGSFDLWRMQAYGGELRGLTTHPAQDHNQRWSPDGQEIVFQSDRSGNEDIWIMPATGGIPRQLTVHEDADQLPCWSPDGQQIVFVSNRGGSDDIWVIPASGGTPKQMTSHTAADWHPDWSPDGEWIVFTSARNSPFGEIWRLRVDGGDPELLTEDGYYPRYSPDGGKIYFRGRYDAILEMSLPDRTQRPVMALTGKGGGPGLCQANDGQYLYVMWDEASGRDIWVMDVE